MVRGLLTRARPWLAPAAVVLALAAALPPVGSYARRYAVIQALQFVIFAVVAPALLALGWPRRSAHAGGQPRRAGRLALLDRTGLRGQPASRAGAALLPFIALVIVWRLPSVLEPLARYPVLTAVELLTLVGGGSVLWRELVGVSAQPRSLPRPLRAGMAAISMWTIWVIAYITGMSTTALVPARSGAAAGNLSAAADRQLAVAVMWAVPAICFLPVVFTMVVTWLGERDSPGREQAAPVSRDYEFPDFTTPPRSPRGWR